MNTYNNSGDANSEKGCILVIGLIVFGFVAQAIIQLLHTLIIVAAIAGFGYIIYRLLEYDKKTGNVTVFLERTFKVHEWKKQAPKSDLPYNEESNAGLPPAPQQEIIEQLNNLKSEVSDLHKENENLKTEHKQDIQQALVQIDRKNKENLLTDIFGNSEVTGYARSDEFEKQQFQQVVKKKEEELQLREIKHEVASHLFEQDKRILEYRYEAKDESAQLREEVRTGFTKVAETFLLVEKEMMTFKSYVVEKFSQLELNFFNELNNIRETIGRMQVDVSKQFSDIKVQFGREIVRLDQQQIRIVDKVQTLHNQVKSFGVEVMQIKNEAERYSIRAEDVLNRANIAYQKHQVAIQSISKDLDLNLQQMSLHKKEFANEVGSSKLQLERISQDQYLALKDIAYEKMGINILRDEYQQRATLEQTKMQNLLSEQKRIEERIQEKISRGQVVDDLKHQLHITQEDLKFTSNRASLIQQEAAAVRRQSK